jgi:hypothetical protein
MTAREDNGIYVRFREIDCSPPSDHHRRKPDVKGRFHHVRCRPKAIDWSDIRGHLSLLKWENGVQSLWNANLGDPLAAIA